MPTLLEIFIAILPEVFVFITGAYILANRKFNFKRIILIWLIASTITYFVKLLPIFPGSNILFSILVMAILLVTIEKMEVMKAIRSILPLFIIRLVTEALNILVLVAIFHVDLVIFADDPVKKTLAFIPSLLLFISIILTIYMLKRRSMKVGTK
ncbi:MAG: hypothetical protein GX783_01745 [Clostridiales bacterium]|nr:hypothetical protein [Clostridiales bacterium]